MEQKNQTARVSELGEMAEVKDTDQKTTDHSVKEEAEEGPSKDLQQEAEDKKHALQYCLNSETFSVTCKTSMTVLEVLNTSKFFMIEKQKKKNTQKEILILRSSGEHNGAAVKTDFPCCLIEKDETLEITFIKKHENTKLTNQQPTEEPSLLSKRSKPEELVTFYVEKEGGPRVTCILKSEVLRKRVRHVCVFAFKGETVKTALKRDGRFNDVIFRKHCALAYFDKKKKHHEFSMPVEDLDRKAFQIVVISDNNLPDSQDAETLVKTEPNVASGADAAENAGPSQNPIKLQQENKQDGNTTKSTNPSTKLYVAKRIDKSEEILGILRDQFKDLLKTLKQRKNLTHLRTFYTEEYGKSVENFLEVKKVRELMRLSDSVCQIRVGETPEGTGFLLFDRFILTNAHVIGDMNFSKTFTAVFGFEGLEAKDTKCIPVKQLIACFNGMDERGRYLDYALLELNAVDGIADYPELLKYYSPTPPERGQICIVGHPGEGVKKMDPCIIIKKEERLDSANKHASEKEKENEYLFNVIKEVFSKEKWEFSAYKNKITYNSCFFHGSSGSPVFDGDCKLIGIHTGGYKYYEEGRKTWSVMEYGFTMQPILENIRARAKIKGLNEIVKILEPYTDKSNESGAVDQQNQTDYEMNDEEESEEP